MLGLTLIFTALAATASATGYIDGREYVYKYSSKFFTGFTRIKKQYSGHVVTGNIHIQPHGDYAYFKVNNLQKADFNEELKMDMQTHPFQYTDIADDKGPFSKPFKVYRKNGIVTHFEVSKGDSPAFVNIKKGIITLFNLNFDEAESTLSTDDNDIHRTDPDRHYYKVYEKGVLGDCETSYLIGHHPYYKTPQNNIVLNVTKTRNYHHCKSTPNQVYGTFYGHECGEVEHEKAHTLHGTAEFYYDIRGYRHQYVIEKIYSSGEVVYMPYSAEGQSASNYFKRNLTLIEEKEVETPFELGSDTDSYSSLEYDFGYQKEFKYPVDLKKPHYLFDIYGYKVPVDTIKGQFEELTHAYNDDTYKEEMKNKNFPAKFVELVKSVGTIGYDDIDTIYKAIADIPKSGATAEQKIYRSIFVDVLANLGTNPGVLYAKHLIERKEARPQEALRFFYELPRHIKEVSEKLLDNLQDLCFHDSVKKQYKLHSACVFSFTSILGDHCVKRLHPELPNPTDKNLCQPEDAIKYFDHIIKNFEQASDHQLKSLYLKGASNIGLREILPYVRPYIEGSIKAERTLRNSAIWAVKKPGFRFPDRVKELLVPLFYNQTENYEFRLSAFIILMMYRPQLYELEQMARSMKYEKDDQVRSYVYSAFKSYANSTDPCDKKLSQDVILPLRSLEKYQEEFGRYDYSFSKTSSMGGFDDHYHFGGGSRLSYFASDSGYIPRSFYFGVHDYFGGKSIHTAGVGFEQIGLEKFFDKILGPEGSFGKRSIFDLFKKRGKRDAAGVEKELNEIKSKIHLPEIEYDPIQGEIFLLHMGNHIASFNFDEKTFEDFFQEGRFSIPNFPALLQKVPQFFYQRFLLPLDQSYVIPTEVGLPLLFDNKQAIYFHLRNKEFSFKVEPGFFAEERGGKFPDHVKTGIDSHIAFDKQLFASMSSVDPFEKDAFGAGINRRATLSFPLKMKFDLDVNEKKLSWKWTPVAPHQVYHFKYEPFTFTDSYTNALPLPQEEQYRPVTRLSRKHMHETFMHEAMGFGLDVSAFYENDFNDKGSWKNFIHEKNYRQIVHYLFANPNFEPYDVHIDFTQPTTGATTEMEASVKYNYYDSEHSQPEFAAEGFEDYKISGENDRAPFCTCALEYDMTLKGEKEKKVHGSLSWTRDLKRSYHKVNFFYDRTPFVAGESNHLKICGSSFLKYPNYDLIKVATLDTIGMNHSVVSELKLHLGKDCSTDQKLKIHGHFKTTDEQREFEAKREEPDTREHYNPYAYYYQKCQKERAQGINYGKFCMDYFRLVSTVHGYDYHAKFEKLSPRFLNLTYKLGGCMKHALYNYGDFNMIGVENPADEFHLHVNYSLHLPVADIRVHKPKSKSHYTNVYLPKYSGFRSYPDFEDMHIKNSFSHIYCKLEGDHVETFDSYEYNLPPIDCYKVIAKDCSRNEFFTVLGTKITHPKYHKAVKVFLGKHKIEALPVSDDSGIIIRVDGNKVAVTTNEPYLHYEGEHTHHGPEFYITFRGFYYALHSEKYGLIVEYDGHNIIIQVSPYYRNKVCGLCGNYNGQKYDGYTTAEGCYYENEAAYAYAYAIPSDTCEVPKHDPKCPNEGGFGCTKLRTQISSKGSDTCFSTEPVAVCAPHCKAKSTISRTLSYHCLPAKDDSTKTFVRQQQFRVIHEVRRKSKDMEAVVEVPDVCLKV